MRVTGDSMSKNKKIIAVSIVFLIVITSFLIPPYLYDLNNYSQLNMQPDYIHSSGETVYNQEWLKNNDFSTQDDWYSTKGAQGDNSTVYANISSNQANFIISGESKTFELSGIPNSVDSPNWYEFEKSINSSYLPDNTGIDSSGCWVSHTWHEGANQFPGVHWRKNVSMPVDMSDYTITSASIDVIFNATVSNDVDVLGESALDQFGNGDFVKFYVHISDVDYKNSYPVALNKTIDLGFDSGPLTITDKSIETYEENVLLTALRSAFEKDPSHANFTITLGIDIYSEDNWGDDWDTFTELRIKSCNLTFSYEKKIDQFSSVSWNQKGNTITGINKQVTDANLKFNYTIDQDWPTALSSFSEIRILINNNPHAETIRLSSANSTLQEAKIGGFDVTNLILKDVNITLSIQVFIANTFDFDTNITISIDDVYLNITYVETFADYETNYHLFLENVNKTIDPFIQIPLENTVNITIKYLDNQTGDHLSGANVQLSGKVSGQLDENILLEQYSTVINSTDLEIGIWSLTVTAQMANYETQQIPFFVDVVERPTDLQLYVNSTLKTNNNTVKIKYNEDMNITISYRDTLINQHISTPNVTITSFGDLTENYEQYTIIINSTALNLGFNVLTINAQSENYTSQMIQLYVEVFERATEFELYVNNNLTSNNDLIQIEVNQILNLTVFYLDYIEMSHLSGAMVSLIGVGNFSENGVQYNRSLNSTVLGLGFNVLSISAQSDNYESQSIQIYIEVYNIASNLTLLVQDNKTKAFETIKVEVNQFVNLTVFYRDVETNQHILGAIVSLGGDTFTVNGSQYYYDLDTNDLSQGITIVTIEAQFNNYQSQTIQIYFEVIERPTKLEVYVNDFNRTGAETILAEVNQILNITVFYRDSVSEQHLNNATVTVLSGNITGDFTEISNQYNYSLNTIKLAQGISILTVIAYLDNYQPRSFQFYVKVSERATELSLFLNSEEKTSDPVYELPFGSSLNITVKYSDNQTKAHIGGGLIQLIEDIDSYDFFENPTMNQYTLLLDTANLSIGMNLLKIVAYANNFQVKTLRLSIRLNKIATIINTTSGDFYFEKILSQSLSLAIVLTDSDFGSAITNATVTYRWAYGQGTLVDRENNGTYTGELENLPTGIYTITITASAGDDYSFNTFVITLNVRSVAPPDFSLLFISLAGGLVALIIGFTMYEVRFKYPATVRKSRKIRKKIRKGKKTKPVKDIISREDLIKDHLENNVEIFQLEKNPENGLKEK